MRGLQGQTIDWKGEDGGWYALMYDSPDVQLSVRLTAPMPEDFPDRQLTTGLGIRYSDGHSIVIETKDPYSTETPGCPSGWLVPCLSENALRIEVDGEEQWAVPTEAATLPDGAFMTALNLPSECQPYGGDRIWAETYSKMSQRHLADTWTLIDWAYTWSASTAAPGWCNKFLNEAGTFGLLNCRSEHAVFRIETPPFTVRLHHGTNHQGGERLEDGRVLPDLRFWQMDVHLERYDVDPSTVTGLMGETIRPVLDELGAPIMSGSQAMRGEVEDYRISGPLSTDFAFIHE